MGGLFGQEIEQARAAIRGRRFGPAEQQACAVLDAAPDAVDALETLFLCQQHREIRPERKRRFAA